MAKAHTKPSADEGTNVEQQGKSTSTQGQSIEFKMPSDVTAENWNTYTKEQLIEKFGNVSNVMRGLVNELGIKPGPVAKHLDKRYQHVRNVTTRVLKRAEAAKRQRPQSGSNQPVSVGKPANAPKGGAGTTKE